MKYLTSLFAILFVNHALADLQNIQVKAFYNSKNGKNANITYDKKKMVVPLERIVDFEHARVGSEVQVVLLPEELGLKLEKAKN